MPHVEQRGHVIHYEVRGEGKPLLMLNHSGASSIGWSDKFLEDLQATRTLVLPDSRGTGRSTDSNGAYSIAELADDAAAILDDSEIPVADILGLSFGGTVAQEFVRLHRRRASRLVLVATFCGQRMSEAPAPWVMALFQPQPGLSRREAIRRMLPIYYSPHAIDEMAEVLISLTERGTRDTPPETLRKQGNALRQFDSYDYLPSLDIGTLVVHGEQDALIPWRSGALLAERIAGAKWMLMEGTGHVIPTERPQELSPLINDFLG